MHKKTYERYMNSATREVAEVDLRADALLILPNAVNAYVKNASRYAGNNLIGRDRTAIRVAYRTICGEAKPDVLLNGIIELLNQAWKAAFNADDLNEATLRWLLQNWLLLWSTDSGDRTSFDEWIKCVAIPKGQVEQGPQARVLVQARAARLQRRLNDDHRITN
eukprot:TRINITY_DN3013_c0_g1_i1.p1 TRINITY_DN3013_c0_g1~~TRINITY_DN3013_c0_g1_i1.p1  ORF type:complete len:164 (+),score=11.73 TRINITY_DN3013_c0_g1_i1:572-1063(+)